MVPLKLPLQPSSYLITCFGKIGHRLVVDWSIDYPLDGIWRLNNLSINYQSPGCTWVDFMPLSIDPRLVSNWFIAASPIICQTPLPTWSVVDLSVNHWPNSKIVYSLWIFTLKCVQVLNLVLREYNELNHQNRRLNNLPLFDVGNSMYLSQSPWSNLVP